jgi:hypothetical protein
MLLILFNFRTIAFGGSGIESGTRGFVNTVESTVTGKNWRNETPMTDPLAWHCASPMDSLTVVVTGGYLTSMPSNANYNKKSYFYNLVTKTWTPGPQLNILRAEHSCSFIKGKDGKPTAIIGGGVSLAVRQNTVEIYNRDLNKWEAGPPMTKSVNAFQVRSLFILSSVSQTL